MNYLCNYGRNRGDNITINMKEKGPSKVAIVYYSMYGHIKILADQIAKGIESTGSKVKLFQVPETIPQSVLDQMQAPPKDTNVDVIESPEVLNEYDGIIFGIPTRFGNMPQQIAAFFDKCASIWENGQWKGKLASTFVSTGTQIGGLVVTHKKVHDFFAHHGMVIATCGYNHPAMMGNEQYGMSAWGAGYIVGADGKRQPSEAELEAAFEHGKLVAKYSSGLKMCMQ